MPRPSSATPIDTSNDAIHHDREFDLRMSTSQGFNARPNRTFVNLFAMRSSTGRW
jgi:hypothetical protein